MSEQSNRALILFGNEHFAAFCLKMEGQPYWFRSSLSTTKGVPFRVTTD